MGSYRILSPASSGCAAVWAYRSQFEPGLVVQGEAIDQAGACLVVANDLYCRTAVSQARHDLV